MTHPVIGEAFVRVRPDFVGFQAQAQTQIQSSLTGVARQTERVGLGARSATRDVERFDRGLIAANASALGFGRALTFASTAFLGGAGLGVLVRAGVEEFSNMTRVAATTNAILKATGGSAGISAQGISALAKQQERLTGADDELVKQAENVLLSFRRIRNEVGQGNDIFTRATRASSDLATVFGQDVPSAARQLGRALADPARGVVLLRRAGVVFTQDQIKLIKALVDTGQVLKAQRLVLDQVESSVGGTAAAVGRTLPGQLNILRERARDALGEYVKRLSESRQAAELAASGARGLNQAFKVVEGTVQAIGPPLLGVAQAAIRLGDAVGGVGPILAAVAAYKAVGIVVGIAANAQAAYARASAVATAANVAETEAVAVESVALDVQAVSLARVGVAGRAVAIGAGAGRVAVSALGGPLGIAAIGATALTLGLLKLRRNAEDAAGGLNATRRALQGLSSALSDAQRLRGQLAGQSEDVSLGNFNVQAAQRGVAAARAAAARSTAAPGSLEQRALANRVTEAEQALTRAERDLAAAQQARDRTLEQLNVNERQRPSLIQATNEKLQAQIVALRTLATLRVAPILAPTGRPTPATGAPSERVKRDLGVKVAREQLSSFLGLTDQLTASGDAVQQRLGGALGTVATTLNRLPTQKQITIAVRLAGQGESTNDIVRTLLGIGQNGEAIRLRGLATQPTAGAALEQEFQAAKKILKAEREKLQTLKDVVAKRRDELQTARDEVTAAQDSLRSAREARAAAIEGLQAARQAQAESVRAVADAITQARAGVTAAVHDAKANLDTLGQSIAQAFGQFADKAGASLGRGGPLGRQFRALRDEILAGRGGPETQRAAQQIASRLSRTPAPDASKLPQQFADLTDAFDRGKISQRDFNRRLNQLLGTVDLQRFQKLFGTAATTQLREQIAALRTQAQLIRTGPQRAGGGVQQTIVRPLQAVATGNRQILQAQHDVRTATRDVAKAVQGVTTADRDIARASHRLQEAQSKEQRKQTVELRAIRVAVQQQLRVQRQQSRLDKPKPDGKAAQTSGGLTNAGAGSP